MRRTSVQLRKELLKMLMEQGELSLRQLESKIDTNYKTIRRQVEDLKSLEFIVVKQQKVHPKNKRPYQVCRITQKGIDYAIKS